MDRATKAEEHLCEEFNKRAEFRSAEKVMREWRIKSDWSENISSDSILEGTHYCYEPILKTMSICAYTEKEQPSHQYGRTPLCLLF